MAGWGAQGQTTPSFGQRDQLRGGHMTSAGQLVLTLRTSAEIHREEQFFVLCDH